MLLKPAAALPCGDQWRYELKFDGFRGVAVKEGESVRLFSRNGRDLSRRFSQIVEAVRKIRAVSAIIDGEIVCLDQDRRPCLQRRQLWLPLKKGTRAFYCVPGYGVFYEALTRIMSSNRKTLEQQRFTRLRRHIFPARRQHCLYLSFPTAL